MRVITLLISLLSGLILLPSISMAQAGGRLSYEKYASVKNTTLIVVMDSTDNEYNDRIKSVMNHYWKLMPVEYVQQKDLDEYARNTDYSMLVRDRSERIRRTATASNVIRRNHLAMYHCDRGAFLKAYGGKEAVTQMEFADIAATDAYSYKLGAIVQSMQHYLMFLDTADITEDTYEYKLDHFQNHQAGQLTSKTLWINEEDLPAYLTASDIQDVYPYQVRLVRREAIQAAIQDGLADVAFLHLGPEVEDIYVLSAAEGRVLYHRDPQEHKVLSKADFRQMAAVADSPPVLQETWSERLDKVGKFFQGGKKKKKGKADKESGE
ncbi:MAG: hypothetical protein AAF399_01255 [Bacteroidota bacterium]